MKAKAQAANRRILVTEMWDNWDPTGGAVLGIRTIHPKDDHAHLQRSRPPNTINHSEIYDFIDISNNNGQIGQVHYETGLWVRNHIATRAIVRPINSVKIYGGPRQQDWCRNGKQGKERFWRNIFAGHAAVRFHRPPSGIGISQEALCQVRSARQLANRVNFFTMVPGNELLGQREANEA